jgi:hypothetical protein
LSFTADQILEQLDAAARAMTFPVLDNGYVYPIDVRLHALRDDAHWAIVIEDVGYMPRGQNVYDAVHVYGNCVDDDFKNPDLLWRVANWEELEDEDEPEFLRSDAAEVELRGTRVPIDAPGGTPLAEVFRKLVPEHRELLLATEDELRKAVPGDLVRLLQLEEWRHPDVTGDELPSDTSTFRQLAEALVGGDASRYAPDAPPNTHWSNWPEGGTL